MRLQGNRILPQTGHNDSVDSRKIDSINIGAPQQILQEVLHSLHDGIGVEVPDEDRTRLRAEKLLAGPAWRHNAEFEGVQQMAVVQSS